MKIFLDQAVDQNISQNQSIHADLASTHQMQREETRKRIDKNFSETEAEKFNRLSLEYDLIRDEERSEWYIVYLRELHEITQLFDNNEDGDADPERWFRYAQFCLKYNMTEKADMLMQKYIGLQGLDRDLNLFMGAMNLQNGNYKKAHQYLFTILGDDWQDMKANLLMGFMYEATNRPGLSRKHFAIAKVKKMRDLN